jgi:hypothetical protein
MAYLYRDQASTALNPVLDVYTHFDGVLTDVYSLKFRVCDITTDANKTEYQTGDPSNVQIFPTTPGTYYSVDVVNTITSSPTPGHKISTGHYYAPFTAPTAAAFGNYVIAWVYKKDATSAEKLFQEEFVILDSTVGGGPSPVTGGCVVEKLRLFMQDFFYKNQLLDTVEYTQQQYELACELSLMRFNTISFLTDFQLANFPAPVRYVLFMGAVGHLLRSTSIEQLRNQLTYTDGNIHVGLTDKHQLYLQAGSVHLQDFDNLARMAKNQLNNDSAWGETHSPYLPPFGGWGAFGSGWGSA